MRVLTVIGTRPEAIKMGILVTKLAEDAFFDSYLCTSGQHRELMYSALDFFKLKVDFPLQTPADERSLSLLTSCILGKLDGIIQDLVPDLILVQGDTTTAMAAAMVGFHRGVRVAHVEAGLRTGDLTAPFPEEFNRQVIDILSTYHFAPTAAARENLLREGRAARSVPVVGNTVIDSLQHVLEALSSDDGLRVSFARKYDFLDRTKKMILVTGHRRENFGSGFKNLCEVLVELSRRRDVQIVFPAHLNPNGREPAREILPEGGNVFLLKPLAYPDFIYMMDRCYFIVSDSGGVQEEAPSLGKPVLVTREVTDRPEVLAKGAVRLVGSRKSTLMHHVLTLLEDEGVYRAMQIEHNPYGDGTASDLIIDYLKSLRIG